jgi:N-acetylglutamate synthase-like GNAT family acetyltransferase
MPRHPTPLTVRRATDADVPALRRLVNMAYRDLGDMGLNFAGVDQDDDLTRRRMRGREVYLLVTNEDLIGTVSLELKESPSEGSFVNVLQLAVHPQHQRQGIGSRLMGLAERRAKELGVSIVRLDTAIPATHLIGWYATRGYVSINEMQRPGKTYRSVVMEKRL